MIKLKIGRIDPSNDANQSVVTYQVAGIPIECNQPLWPLEPYRLKQSVAVSPADNNVEHVDFRRPRLRRTTGWLGDRIRHIKTVNHHAGTEVYIEGVGRLFVSSCGTQIELPGCTDDAHRELLIEAAVGPALCLALATQDIFCLHASTVVGNGRATLFCGLSGAGKSTLAQRLPGHPGFDLRLADDVSATSITTQGASCLGHFPQLKLGVDEHCINPQSRSVPIERIVLLKKVQAEHQFRCGEMDSSDGVLALARHTVASRLFSPELMKHHLGFCAELANHAQVTWIDYPHTAAGVDLVVGSLSGSTMDIAST